MGFKKRSPPVKQHGAGSGRNLSTAGRPLVWTHQVPKNKYIEGNSILCTYKIGFVAKSGLYPSLGKYKAASPRTSNPWSVGWAERLNISTKRLVQLCLAKDDQYADVRWFCTKPEKTHVECVVRRPDAQLQSLFWRLRSVRWNRGDVDGKIIGHDLRDPASLCSCHGVDFVKLSVVARCCLWGAHAFSLVFVIVIFVDTLLLKEFVRLLNHISDPWEVEHLFFLVFLGCPAGKKGMCFFWIVKLIGVCVAHWNWVEFFQNSPSERLLNLQCSWCQVGWRGVFETKSAAVDTKKELTMTVEVFFLVLAIFSNIWCLTLSLSTTWHSSASLFHCMSFLHWHSFLPSTNSLKHFFKLLYANSVDL